MLWLHFGVPKTGTTSFQSFLHANQADLAGAGLHYMNTGRMALDGKGRRLGNHSKLVNVLSKTPDDLPLYAAKMAEEYAAHHDKACVVSSEIFYLTNFKRLAQVFAQIPTDQIRIVYYCRRYDDYFEAEYKQRAKNGKVSVGATAYVQERLAEIADAPDKFNYSGKHARIQAAFPGVTIQPRIYERSQLVNRNLIDDMLDLMGVQTNLSTQTHSNPSLSRVGSEAFGVLTRTLGRQASRQIRRRVPDDAVMQRKHDVLEAAEREAMNALLGATDVDFCETHFPGRDRLFAAPKLSGDAANFTRDTAQDMADFQAAMQVVMRLAFNIKD